MQSIAGLELGLLKPLLTTLALPPVSLLLLAFLGLLIAAHRKRGGIALALFALALLWLLSCHGAAVWLARHALPQFAPVAGAALKAARVQAVVVLGGGLLPEAPEYGEAQPNAQTAARVRYGLRLARQSGLPVAFSGGLGWAADEKLAASEASTVVSMARDYGVALRWVESASRDTADNARLLAPLLRRDGIARIALVTHASHMPRAAAAFARAGFTVTPAPTGYVLPEHRAALEWLPSASGLQASHTVLREYLGLIAARWLTA